MSETLRELVVALSLNSSDFEKHIRLVNKDIRKFESEFKLAGAGIEGFEKTMGGMKEKAKLLRRELNAQNEIVGQYQGKLQQLTQRMQENQAKHSNYTVLIENETKARDELKKKVDEQRKEVIALTEAYGADDDRTKAAAEQLAQYSGALDEANKSVKKAQGNLAVVQKSIYSTGTAITDTETKLNRVQAEVKELTVELLKNESAWYKHGVAMQEFGKRTASAAAGVEKVGGALTKTVTVPILGLGAAAAKASIDYESAFAGVRKTVDATGEDAEEFFETLSDGVIDMSKRLATGAGDIAEVMAIAGQLGIANEELNDFTETIVRLGMSTDMAGEDAASSMARFANITGMAQGQFEKMGATLVYLGNHFATTESEIMSMAVRIAAAGDQVGLSEAQILGFAAALSSLGLEAEAGGSAFSKALKKMETAVATNSKALGDFAKVAGMTKQEFAEIWKEDPAEAFSAFITGLSQMNEQGIGAIATLEEIGITELRLSDTLLRTANANELLKNSQTAANQAWEEGTALIKESDTRLQTMASRLTNVKNSLTATGIAFGETMTPMLEDGAKWLEDAVEWFGGLDEAARKNIVTWGLYAAATGPVIKGIGKVGTAIGTGARLIGEFSEHVGKVKAQLEATGSAASLLGAVLGPGGKMMLGIAGATAAIAGLIALYNRVQAAKPDLSIDTSEIENLKIDVDDLKIKAEADMQIELKEGVKNAGEQIIDILNDGVPEGEEEQKQMSAAVQGAIGAAYDAIREKFNAEKAELDALYAGGIIDKTTYDQSMTELTAQATAMQTELDASAKAVNDYITLMVANNRKMTEEEIAELDKLLEKLGLTAEKVMQANEAEKQVYASRRLAF